MDVDEVIEHFGVKGMHWGQRKASDESSGSSSRAIAKSDAKFEKKAVSTKSLMHVYDAAAEEMNRVEVPRINGKAKYQGIDFTKPSKVQREYYKEYSDAMSRALNKHSSRLVGQSSTKKLEFKYDVETGEMHYALVDLHAQHADDTGGIHITFDKLNHIVSISFTDPSMAQSDDDFMDAILEHHGVKGMHWGVRKSAADQITRLRTPKHPASEDAVTAKTHKARVKSAGTDALSTDELQKLVTRLNLEQQYSRIAGSQSAKGQAKKFIADLILSEGKKQATKLVADQAGKLVAQAISKKATGK